LSSLPLTGRLKPRTTLAMAPDFMMMACAVCFGAVEPLVRESMNAGILVLLGVTAVVLGCFARFFLTLARRSREAAHLVETRQERTV
jgi:hypothetical protein